MAHSQAPAVFNPAFELFHCANVQEIVPRGQELVTASVTDNVQSTLEKLESNQIQSVPVFDQEKYVGVVDSEVLFKFCLYYACHGKPTGTSVPVKVNPASKTFHMGGQAFCPACPPSDTAFQSNKAVKQNEGGLSNLKEGPCPRNCTLKEVLQFAKDCGMTCSELVMAGDSVAKLARHFGKHKGLHRAIVANQYGRPCNVVSQSDVLHFLSSSLHKSQFKCIDAITAFDLSRYNPHVVTINKEETLAKAIDMVSECGVSCLGVVDNGGRLVGNFSSSNFKGMFSDYPHFNVNRTIGDYLQRSHPESMTPLCCIASLPLRDVIAEMLENKVHHIFLVDESTMIAQKVISMTDILECIRSLRVLYGDSGDPGVGSERGPQIMTAELLLPTPFQPILSSMEIVRPVITQTMSSMIAQLEALQKQQSKTPRMETGAATKHIRMDTFETETYLLLVAECPGMTKQDVSVSLDEEGQELHIFACSKVDRAPQNASTLAREIESKPMERTYTLPAGRRFDLETGLTAKLDDGILEITITKLN